MFGEVRDREYRASQRRSLLPSHRQPGRTPARRQGGTKLARPVVLSAGIHPGTEGDADLRWRARPGGLPTARDELLEGRQARAATLGAPSSRPT